MPDIIHKDYESRSRANIKKVGTYRYAEDESTEIFCAAIAVNDEEPKVWINPKFEIKAGLFEEVKSEISEAGILDLSQHIHVNKAEVWAHNAQFEHAITKYHGAKHGIIIEDDRWRCTAALCRRAAIPASLEKASLTLNLKQQKDSTGSALIRKFSTPNKKTGEFLEPQQDPAAFKQFVEYCRQDVRVEQQIHRELMKFNLTGTVLQSFLLDLRINSRGLEVNLDALRHVQDLIITQEAELAAQFKELTGFGHGQQKVFMVWLKEQGYAGDNIRASTMEEEFSANDFDPSSDLGRALTIRKKLSFASIKKVKSMIACACSDGTVRGTLKWHGAGPGRASGQLIQPQNFKRATIKLTALAYRDICDGESTEHLEMCYGPMMETVSSCIRHFIQPHQGVLLDVDFSSIEAREVNWLAGQNDVVKMFREYDTILGIDDKGKPIRLGQDLYKVMAAVIYNVPVDEVDEFPQRFVGKQARLGCGYSMGGPKFRMTCKNYGYDLPWTADIAEKKTNRIIHADIPLAEAELFIAKQENIEQRKRGTGSKLFKMVPFEDRCIKKFRETHKEVVKFWYACEKAVKAAIGQPGAKFPVGKITFFCATTAGAKYLFIRLPSGRRIAYRDPKVMLERKPVDADSEDFDEEEGEDDGFFKKEKFKFREYITYWGQLDGKAMWGDVRIYGGLIVENICQGMAADLLANGIIKAEAAGIEIATQIHDQILAYCRDASEAPAKLAILEAAMTDLPEWAAGLPVAVEGKITPYYKK